MKKIFIVMLLMLVVLLVSCSKTESDTYTITWKNYDGKVLEVDKNVKLNAVPSYNGKTPIREDKSKYSFKGWSPNISPVSKNQVYTATFSLSNNIPPQEVIPPTPSTITITPSNFSAYFSVSVNGTLNANKYSVRVSALASSSTKVTSKVTATIKVTFTFNYSYYISGGGGGGERQGTIAQTREFNISVSPSSYSGYSEVVITLSEKPVSGQGISFGRYYPPTYTYTVTSASGKVSY